MTNSVDPDQTAPIGAVCSGSTLFASILNSSVMLGIYLQQTTSADDFFRCIFFLAPGISNDRSVQMETRNRSRSSVRMTLFVSLQLILSSFNINRYIIDTYFYSSLTA